MKAEFTKIIRPDPSLEGKSYSDHVLLKDVEYCCDSFREFCKKFPSWSYEKGRFTVVNQITYEESTQTEINYCPFCGEKIKYREIKKKKA